MARSTQRRVRLTNDAWRHIARNHPEIQGWKSRILETVSEPDVLAVGEAGELWALKRYEFPQHGGKYLLVPFREVEGVAFIITAYVTDIERAERRLRKVRVLWRKQS
jgi:hypothetical protein